MDKKNYDRSWNSLKESNRYLIITIVLLAASLMMSMWHLVNRDTTTIVVPRQMTEQFSITSSTATSNYFEQWGWLVSMSLGNVTEKTYMMIKDNINQLLSPAIRIQVLVQMDDDMAAMKANKLEISFIPKEVYSDPETGEVWVTGLQKKMVLGKAHQSQNIYYYMQWTIDNFQPTLQLIETHEGTPKW
jgi:type IV conjugative transfer system protein TraE